MTRRGERGETLLETLLAIVVLGIAVSGAVAAFGLAATGAALDHGMARGGQAAISAAEYLQRPSVGYVACAEDDHHHHHGASGTYVLPDPAVAIESIEYLGASGAFDDSCTAGDRGAQRITVVVRVGGRITGRAVTVKRRP